MPADAVALNLPEGEHAGQRLAQISQPF